MFAAYCFHAAKIDKVVTAGSDMETRHVDLLCMRTLAFVGGHCDVVHAGSLPPSRDHRHDHDFHHNKPVNLDRHDRRSVG